VASLVPKLESMLRCFVSCEVLLLCHTLVAPFYIAYALTLVLALLMFAQRFLVRVANSASVAGMGRVRFLMILQLPLQHKGPVAVRRSTDVLRCKWLKTYKGGGCMILLNYHSRQTDCRKGSCRRPG